MTSNDGAAWDGAAAHQQQVPAPAAGTHGPGALHGQTGPSRNGALGWLFLAPAMVLVLVQQFIPAVRTVLLSLQEVGPLGGGGTWVGLANYQEMFNGPLLWALRPSIILGLFIAVVGFPIGFGLGRLGSRATGTPRRVALALAGLALVFLTPTAALLGLSQWVDLRSAAQTSAVIAWLPATILIGFLIGVTLAPGRGAGRTLLLGSAVAAMAGVALTMQSTTGLLVAPSPHSPGSAIYHLGLVTLQTGAAAAISTVLLGIAVVLGVLATRALLASRLRLRIRPRDPQPDPSGATAPAVVPGATVDFAAGDPRAGSGAGAVIAGAVVLVIALVASLPWLLASIWSPGDPAFLAGAQSPEIHGAGAALLRTWLGGGGQVLIAVVVAVLAGAGIGYYRPLGERSLPVLLTVLSPALFVGLLPLLTVHVLDRSNLGLLGTFPGSLYPQVVVVPLVFLSAHLADAWRAAGVHADGGRPAPMTTVIATIGLAAAALLIMRADNPAWSLTVNWSGAPDASVLAFQAWQRFMIPEALGLIKPVPVLLVLAVVVTVCAIGMRRLRLEHVGSMPHSALEPEHLGGEAQRPTAG